MKCTKCGTELGENDAFCPKCGTQVRNNGGEGAEKVVKKQSVSQPKDNVSNNAQNISNKQQVNAGQANTQNNNGRNGSVVKAVIITILVIAILASAGYGVYTIVDKIKGNNNNNNNEESRNTVSTVDTNTNSNRNSNENTNSNNSTNTTSGTRTSVSTSTYKVSYNGFKLYIPDNLVYELNTKNNSIIIGDALSTWAAQMSIQKIPFQQLKQNKSYLTTYFNEYFASYNATISAPNVETIDGVEFITMEAKIAGTNEIMAFAQLNSMYTACFDVINHNNDFDKTVLKNLTAIIKTAEFTGETKNIEMPTNIQATDLNKILQKTTEANATENNATNSTN